MNSYTPSTFTLCEGILIHGDVKNYLLERYPGLVTQIETAVKHEKQNELATARARIETLETALRSTLASYDYLRQQLSQYDLIVGQSENIKQARAALQEQS